MDLSKYKNKGYIGLENLGNTCFLNSCLQVLNHTYEFNELLDKKQPINKTADAVIFTEWNDLRKLMWSNNGLISPKRFVLKVRESAKAKNKDLFTGFMQNDLSEFLLFFMECLHSSISREVIFNLNGNVKESKDKLAIVCYKMLQEIYKKEYSEIMEMFYGIYVSEIRSKETNEQHSVVPQSYFVLDLPIFINNEKQMIAKNLYGCLDLFTYPEYLEGDNAWMNEKTGKRENIQKRMIFWNFPPVLVITLNRFSIDGMKRINNLIDFPINDLNLSKYVCGYNEKSYVYDLFGVCNHFGSVSGGHYSAFVKNYKNEWIHYDDEHNEVVNDLSKIVSSNAYCLFYRKKNN